MQQLAKNKLNQWSTAMLPKVVGCDPPSWEAWAHSLFRGRERERQQHQRIFLQLALAGLALECVGNTRPLSRTPQASECIKKVIATYFMFAIAKHEVGHNHYFLCILRLGDPCGPFCRTPHTLQTAVMQGESVEMPFSQGSSTILGIVLLPLPFPCKDFYGSQPSCNCLGTTGLQWQSSVAACVCTLMYVLIPTSHASMD